MRTWALELELTEMDKPRRKKAHVKGLDLYPLIWADGNMRPYRPDKTRLSPKRHNQWCGWVTHVRIDENPGIRGHDRYFDKTCQGNRFAKRTEVEQ